ncbi:MAG: hypothetical protein AB7L13_04015 [Acidimicrobiia bacterium]
MDVHRTDLRRAAYEILDRHWQPLGYTAPNELTYPWLWLWDSCFHAIVWAELGRPDRAIAELRAVFFNQTPSGFVPHIGYQRDPGFHASFWGREGASTITQPPMYGHAIAELRRRGIDVPADLVERAGLGIDWLLRHRRRGDRSLVICHPWESGCDDSPAWDRFGNGDKRRWYERKGEFVRSLVLDDEGAAVANPKFEVDSPGFSALVVFNAAELGIEVEIEVRSDPLTADGLLGCLAGNRPDLLSTALDDSQFGGRYGPAGVNRTASTFDPSTYWRGPAWPQLTYLLFVAAQRSNDADAARRLATALVEGATISGFAEYWHPDTGAGLGAIPQSWATLAVVAEAFMSR